MLDFKAKNNSMQIRDEIKHLTIDNDKLDIKWLVNGKISPAIRVINFCLTKKKFCAKQGIEKVVKVDFASIEPI